MTRKVLAGAEAEEFKRLFGEYTDAMIRGNEILRRRGIDSPEFAEADRAAGDIRKRLRELLGEDGKHWMA